MFGFNVPIISVVIGEGGSGGALAIGCSNYTFIMEHSVYYVASPEACAAILWKSREKSKAVSLQPLALRLDIFLPPLCPPSAPPQSTKTSYHCPRLATPALD